MNAYQITVSMPLKTIRSEDRRQMAQHLCSSFSEITISQLIYATSRPTLAFNNWP